MNEVFTCLLCYHLYCSVQQSLLDLSKDRNVCLHFILNESIDRFSHSYLIFQLNMFSLLIRLLHPILILDMSNVDTNSFLCTKLCWKFRLSHVSPCFGSLKCLGSCIECLYFIMLSGVTLPYFLFPFSKSCSLHPPLKLSVPNV